MQTIKTAVVVVLLLVVLYGAYIAINGANTDLPPELQAMLESEANLDVDIAMPGATSFSGTSQSSGFSNNSGLKPAAAPTFDGPAPNFGSNANANSSMGTLAPPKLAPLPVPALEPLNSFNKSVSIDSKTGLAPPAISSTQISSGSPTIPGMTPASGSTFGLNVKEQNESSASSLDSPPAFGVPVKTVANENQFTPMIDSSNLTSTAAADESIPLGTSSKAVNITGKSFESAKQVALDQISRGLLKEALATLSVFYGSPELSESQNRDLIDLLDSLAAETIYSRRHLLDTPYVVGPSETIETVAKRFEIPAELLARINAVEPHGGLTPGTKLKVFQGPFRAEVDMKRNEMTVFLGELYAGRFPVSTGADPVPKEGVFQVLDKQRNRNYYGLGGTQIDGQDPRNPYGGWWIDLGQDVSIHGTPSSGGPENAKLGCISLSPLDAGDVFFMLSRGSQVTIKR